MENNICLVTWGNSINYGTCIQCYALAKYLRNQGYNVIIPDSYKYYYGINHPIETIRIVKDSIINKLIKRKKNNSNDIFQKRIESNKKFAYEVSKLISINSKSQFEEIVSKCDSFITGSDQIWNPNYIKTPMLLSFVPSGKNKIAYASSIGVNELPNNKKRMYKKYLNRFDYIGVREKTAKEILKELTNIDIQVVLDPSFLIDKDDWEKIAKKPVDIDEKDEFVFGYFIGDARRNEEIIKTFLEKNSYKLYYAISENNIKYSFGNGNVDYGVEEFIWCLLHAKYIITDSFHATALSINFNKNFFVLQRFLNTDKKSQNSRIYDLLSLFNLLNYAEAENTKLDNIVMEIDYNKVNNQLGYLRKESYNYLNNALKGN
ncbi:MAG: polysaccharide pyruvyl transferase family protein [Clostridia bacterium]|nr:polysaccharide pyruvyl transferase family protein [Bacilli bacterium]MBR3511502.1 polysaccharide pyruvyl transferase family protein [Clostridia bacterium]